MTRIAVVALILLGMTASLAAAQAPGPPDTTPPAATSPASAPAAPAAPAPPGTTTPATTAPATTAPGTTAPGTTAPGTTTPAAGAASGSAAEPAVRLPEVDVIGQTPLLGSGADRAKVPAMTDVLTAPDISRTGIPDLVSALGGQAVGVSLGNTSGNPFQPDILFRGFLASPVEGDPQGLAVYVNGVRFNQPLGDTVNWDLIPPIAIERVNIESSKPVFGLNALGGSVSVRLRNGFDYQGGEVIGYTGSYSRFAGTMQYGTKSESGDTSAYFATNLLYDGGYRETAQSNLRQFYGDVGWRSDTAEVHVNVLGDLNTLGNPGATPEILLSVAPSSVFTAPNTVTNNYVLSSITGNADISDDTSVQGVAYVGNLSQRLVNGVTTDGIFPCPTTSTVLCTTNFTGQTVTLTTRNGAPIPNFENGGFYSGNSYQGTDSTFFGASAQVANHTPIFGLTNDITAGLSFDGGDSLFDGYEAIGGITSNRFFVGPGITIDQADGSITPTRVRSLNDYYGAYFSDLLSLTPSLLLSISGRLNVEDITLQDQIGTALNGSHDYSRFNPGLGLTYEIMPGLSAFASYAEANRAPTPAELSCADVTRPCQLANFFISDPSLKQVVSHTIEAGLRGRFHPMQGATVAWMADIFHTSDNDDIIYVTSPISNSLANFANIGQTLRQGFETKAQFTSGRWQVTASYAYTDATYQSPFSVTSPNNPGANPVTGQIFVQPGNHIPGIPANQFKIVTDYRVTDAWTAGMSLVANSSQYLYGDQANLTPQLPAYAVLSLNTSYQITPNFQVFGLVTNITNEKYYAYGTFGPVTAVPLPPQAQPTSNTRVYTPSAPIQAYVGAKVTF